MDEIRIYTDDLNAALRHNCLQELHPDFNGLNGMTLDMVVAIVMHETLHKHYLQQYIPRRRTDAQE